jgi:hypothetical protein
MIKKKKIAMTILNIKIKWNKMSNHEIEKQIKFRKH